MRDLKRAIGYLRVSTDGQAKDDKYGVDLQKETILKYADDNGYVIVEWRLDKCSGASDNRPSLNSILYNETVANPPYEAVIVFKNDRIARDTKLYFYYLYILEKRGVKLLSAKEKFEEGSEMANIYRSLLQFVAEQERKNITVRTTKGRVIKATAGGYSGGRPPYGYVVKDKQLVIDQNERVIVIHIFRRRKEGWSYEQIADELTAAGFVSRKGTPFTWSGIRSILNNEPVYRGKYRYGTGEWVKGEHEPIF